MDTLAHLKKALEGRYEIERELGHGGMATVYLAQDDKHRRKVAIKVLDPEIARVVGPERFLREIETTAKLTHPHILPLLDSGDADGVLYYVMPYVEGASLRDRLRDEKQLPMDEAIRITREAATALDHAHQQGVLHRDIKPENILLEAGQAVVADFGIARAVQAAGGGTLTETGVLIGTPAYMSPEQASGRGELDGRSDVYSLGCVLYEMLAGQPPFRSDTPIGYLHQHVEEEPRPIAELRPGVSAEAGQIVERSLAKLPVDRYATAGEFAKALTPPFAPVTVPTRAGKKRWRAALASTAALVALVVAVVIFWPPRGNTPGSRVADPAWILLADFDGPADEPEVAGAVQNLVSLDLEQSFIIRPVPRDQLQYALALADKPKTTKVTTAVARELAVRNSIRTVLEGRVFRLGTGYSISLRVIDAEKGDPALSLRESAKNKDDIISAVGRLTRSLLGELGEKESDLRSRRFLWQIATPSFEAYQMLTKSLELSLEGRHVEAISSARGAVELDPDCAAAWYRLGFAYSNVGKVDSTLLAYDEALKRFDRLDAMTQALVAAESPLGNADLPAALRGYEQLIENHPEHSFISIFYNNWAYTLKDMGLHERACEGFEKAIETSPLGPYPLVQWNLAETMIILGRLADAQDIARQLGGPNQKHAELEIVLAAGDWAAAESVATSMEQDPSSDAELRARAAMVLAGVQAARGAARGSVASFERAGNNAREVGLPPWVQQARRLQIVLAALAGHDRSPSTDNMLADSTISSLVTLGMIRTASGDLDDARECLRAVKSKTAADLARHDGAASLLEAWIARSSGQWEVIVEKLAPLSQNGGEVGRIIPVDGPGRPLARWLVAEAYEQLGNADSAAFYYELAVSPDRLFWEERVQHAVVYSFLHQRLVMLYAQLGELEKSRGHWEIFSKTFIRPDPELRSMQEEAQSVLASL